MHNPHLKPHLPSQPVNLKSAWGKLLAFARPWLPIGITGMVLAMVASIFALMGPDKLRDMTNLIQEGLMGEIDMDAIFRTGITLVILYGLAAIGHYIQHYLMATFTQRVSQALRQSISRKINQVPLGYYNQVSFGDVLSRVTNDVDTIGQTMNQSLGNLVTSVTMFLGSLLMMFITNSIMAVTAIVSTILGFGLMMLIIRKSQKYFVGQQQYLGQLNGHIEEIYTGHNVVKAYNGEQAAQDTFDQINGNLYNCAWKSQFLSGLMQPLMGFVGNLGYVAVCVVGAGSSPIPCPRLPRRPPVFSPPPPPPSGSLTSWTRRSWPMNPTRRRFCRWKRCRAMWNSPMSASAIPRRKPSSTTSPPTPNPARRWPL